ncbi:hypothetical protein GGI07_003326 [Coemansia sp. Benny D115]|nr:hypothetical protein GGI07_003326 [Coemansia sp. Benny D115]
MSTDKPLDKHNASQQIPASGTPVQASKQQTGLSVGIEQAAPNKGYEIAQSAIEDVLAKQQYARTGKSLQKKISKTTPEDFIDKLGLSEAYEAYKTKTAKFFTEHALRMPAFESKKLWPYNSGQSATPAMPPATMPNTRSQSKKARQQGAKAAQPRYPPRASASTSTSPGYGKPVEVNESQLFREFTNTWESLTEEYIIKFKNLNPLSAYQFANFENARVPDSNIKPDGVLFLASTDDKTVADIHILFEAKISEYSSTPPQDVIGQMAEYSRDVWSAQPTRTFVPVFLLHGGKLSLFVFLRSDVLRINLGYIFYKNPKVYTSHKSDVAECLMRLMFLTQQTPKNFGHFADLQAFPSYMMFSGDKHQKEAKISKTLKSGAVAIKERIERTVPLRLRAAYLYRAEWEDKKVVLKLSWTPHDRQPEGAIYDILKCNNVSGIPEIYDSGILIKNFFGYRLEYILMEDCGATVNTWRNDHFWCSLHSNCNIATPEDLVSRVVSKVISCLWQARLAGVLHRDISTGNIAVNSKGDVFVIDWGYAKPIGDGIDKSVKDDVEKDWGIKIAEVSRTESQFDPLTGTLCFMGIRMLLGHSDRSTLDDFESLLYVALAMFAQWYLGDENFRLTKLQNIPNQQAAMAKVGSLACRQSYPIFFGVNPAKAESVCKTLEPFYDALFTKDDAYIGPRDDLVSIGAANQAPTPDTPTLTGPQRALQMQRQTRAIRLGVDKENIQDMWSHGRHLNRPPQDFSKKLSMLNMAPALGGNAEQLSAPFSLDFPPQPQNLGLTGSVAANVQAQNMASGALEQRAMSDALLKDYLGEIVWDYAKTADDYKAGLEIADACKIVITTVPELPQKYLESIMKFAKRWPGDFNKAIVIRAAIDFYNTRIAAIERSILAPKSNSPGIGLGNLNIASQPQLPAASPKRSRDPDDDNNGRGQSSSSRPRISPPNTEEQHDAHRAYRMI